MGFSLYNPGFAAGVVGLLVAAVFGGFGFVPFTWGTEHKMLLGMFLGFLFVCTASLGLLSDSRWPG